MRIEIAELHFAKHSKARLVVYWAFCSKLKAIQPSNHLSGDHLNENQYIDNKIAALIVFQMKPKSIFS